MHHRTSAKVSLGCSAQEDSENREDSLHDQTLLVALDPNTICSSFVEGCVKTQECSKVLVNDDGKCGVMEIKEDLEYSS